MKKRVFFLAVAVLILISFAYFSSAVEVLRFENIYFKLCADAFCDDNRIAFSPDEGRMYIRAYNFNGAELSGEITKPDGEEGALEFSHLFSQDDYTIIYFSGEGTYRGNVKAVKDGYLDFEKEFTFYVGEKSEIIDLSKYECSDVSPVSTSGADSLRLEGNFDSVLDSARITEFLQNTKDNSYSNNWNSWSCPPNNLRAGETCYPTVDSNDLLSYSPSAVNDGCSGSREGEFRTSRNVIWNDKSIEFSMSQLAFKLKSESDNLLCAEGCYKQASLDIIDSKIIDNDGLYDSEVIVYNYRVECKSIVSPVEWKIEWAVEAQKMCLDEAEKTKRAVIDNRCENLCPAAGARKCSGKGYVACADSDNNGCLEWGDIVACNTGEKCDLGICYKEIKVDTGDDGICTNQCSYGETECSGGALKTCGNYDSDSCTEWRIISCPSGQTCQISGTGAECKEQICEDECAIEGMRQCYVEGRPKYRICGNYDSDRCLEWSSGQTCLEGQICFEGQCRIGELDNCIDSDGDGFGVGAGCAVQDCNDGDSSVWELIEMCYDWDGDGYGIKQSYGRPLLSPQCVGIMPLGIIAGKMICPADDANLDCNDDDSSIHTGCGSCPVCDSCNKLFSASVTGSSAVSLSEVNGCGFMNGVFSLNKQPAYELSNTCFWGGVDTRGTSGLVYCENGYWKWNEIANNFNAANKFIDVTSLKAVKTGETCAPVGQFILQGMCAKDLGYGGNLQITT